ncbi:MAG: SURF1 family protein [Pseudomonadota bacterium]
MPLIAGRLRPLLGLTVFAGLGMLVLLGLGTWQLERRAWKESLIAARVAGLNAPAIALPDRIPDPAALEYRRVWVEGRFRHDHELDLIGRFYRDQPGYQIVTPLILADGSAVLVNRGFVPLAAKDPTARPAGQIVGPVRLEGAVRLSAVPGWLTPDNQPGNNVWFYPNVAQMAAAAGLAADVRPVFIEAGPAPNPGGLPIGGQTEVNLPNDHLQYAITWYSLAVALAVIYGIFCHRHLSGDRPSWMPTKS